MPADTWFPFQSPIDLPDAVELADALAIVKIGFVPCPFPIMLTTADVSRPGPVITYVNAAFFRMSGFTPEELIGSTPRRMQGPMTDRSVLDRLKTELPAGRCFSAQTINYQKDGTPYVVRWTIAPVRHRGAVVRFVSYQQRFPLMPERPVEFTPAEAAGLGALVVELTPVGIAVTDEFRRVVWVNAAFGRLAGRPADGLLGEDLLHVRPAGAVPATAEDYDQFLAGMPLTPADWEFPAAGGPRTANVAASRLAFPTGRRYAVWAATDVTARVRLEDQFRQAQKMEAVGRLAGGVAHDFNNLLTIILGNLELLELPATDPGAGLLANARVAADRAADLTQNLLGFARRRSLRVAPLDAAAMLAETAAILRRVIDPRVVIHVDPPAAPARPLADEGAVQQAVLNLCLNARDAMPDGGRLTLSAEPVTIPDPPSGRGPDARPGRFVVVGVADTGCGMDAATLAQVFEPFFTTKPADRGTGLGLAMVDGTVRQHGGWVEVQSQVGVGTRFDLYLPAADDHDAAAAPSPSAAQAPASPTPAGLRVLVIDDDPAVRAVAVAILGRGGFVAAVAASADTALAWAAANPGRTGVVLLDQNMPGRPTAEAVPLLRTACPGARILIASGKPPDAALAAAVDGYVPKPYTFTTLVAAVKAAAGVG